MSINGLIKQYKITLLVSGFILILCLIPLPSKETWLRLFPCLAQLKAEQVASLQYTDKIVHALFYVILSGVCLYESHRLQVRRPLLLYVSILLYCLAWGGMIEGVQALLPYRSGNWADMAANGLGTLLGFALYFLISIPYERKNLSDCHHPPR